MSIPGKSVVVVRGSLAAGSAIINVTTPLIVVGRNSALLTPSPGLDGLTITSGDITLRNLTIRGSASPATGLGIKASPDGGSSVTLRLDTCAVIENPGGGILLNGAGFEIRNTTVSNNKAGTLGLGTFGGILVNEPPAAGPAILANVTIQNNEQVGLVCSGAIPATSSVLSSGNVSEMPNPSNQISSTCGISPCTSASPTCGAQSSPQ